MRQSIHRIFIRCELLEEIVEPANVLWDLNPVGKIFKRQDKEGFWKYPGKTRETHANQDYNQLETFRRFGELVEKYGLNRDHPRIEKAAQYLFNSLPRRVVLEQLTNKKLMK